MGNVPDALSINHLTFKICISMATEKNVAASTAKTTPKKKRDVKLTTGVLTVKTTENNTMISLADENGNKISG